MSGDRAHLVILVSADYTGRALVRWPAMNGRGVSKIRVLLLTNRDSDNVGDQIIEATAISLISAAFKNLDVPRDDFEISSRAAGIITKAYIRTKDPALLAGARKAISNADVIVFGGAPLFNYAYQNFYLRTIVTLELAQEYGVPVLFSSIGVEPFNAKNRKSLALKEALALPVVRQITTRDDYESLSKYVEGTDVTIAHVSDPAVFADIVFGTAATRSGEATESGTAPAHKRIGLVVTRAGIFKDNKIPFSAAEQQQFWLDVVALLTERGYDYKLFTTGHFTDEEFLQALVKAGDIPRSKAALKVNSPEELIDELSACDGVIAYRLHASITAFAYAIPSIGLTWNFKVPYFYESVGHGDRALDHTQWTARDVVAALEKAMSEGVTKDEAFLMSVYETLFAGLKEVFVPDSERTPYSYAELREHAPPYGGTTRTGYQRKLERKWRRADEHYMRKDPTRRRRLASTLGRARWKARRALGRVRRIVS